ncbi:hypothetical protein ACIRL3_35130 [Streptomyces sp. NPDC102384]|uniref:hypothetical protein n=1 Tax=Streptomyces sp. NPDC102384 TaxID=3366166 RepID=UPI0038019858
MRQIPHDAKASSGKGVFAGGPLAGDQLVGLFLRGGQRLGAGGLVAGDNHGVVGVGVQADEAEVADRAEAGLAQPTVNAST